jgi:VCBS repeat-containing protein
LALPFVTGLRLAEAAPSAARSLRAGAVYTLTNEVAANKVAIFYRAADGGLTPGDTVATGGTGTGAGLGSQGALALSRNGEWLYAVNAGSNNISVLRVGESGLEMVQKIDAGGSTPISLAIGDRLLYVLNAGGNGNIMGFTIGPRGTLTALSGSSRGLGGNATGPAQVGFSGDGDVLVVTEKAANAIVTYTIGRDGRPGQPMTHPSSGATPFGFDFARRDILVVSEATGNPAGGSAVSSYAVGDGGGVHVRTASLPDHQAAACWTVATESGRYAYVANAGSGSISGLRVDERGQLTLLNANGITATTGAGSHPTDEAMSLGSRYLYVLLTPAAAAGGIAGFAVGADGSLQPVNTVTGLPMGSAAGLAAR